MIKMPSYFVFMYGFHSTVLKGKLDRDQVSARIVLSNLSKPVNRPETFSNRINVQADIILRTFC